MSLRIALTHWCAWPEVRRGTERYLHELGAALLAAGHEVEILTTTPGAPHTGRERGVPVRYLRRRPVLRRRFGELAPEVGFGAQALARLASRPLDVWHAMGTADAAAAAELGRVRRLRSVYTDHGFPFRPSRERRPDRRLHEVVVAHVDHYVCVSEAAGATLLDGYGRHADVRSGGVDTRTFEPGGRRHSSPVVLFAGDAGEERKNLPLLATAVARLRRGGTPAELWVAGPGDQVAAVRAGGLDPGAARLLGTVAPDDLRDLYRSAWVTALPARAEAFGLVLVESLACGTPVLALDQGGPRDIVTPDVGRLVAEDELAAGLLEVLDLAGQPDAVDACRTASLTWDWRTAVVPHLERLYGS